MAFPFVPKNMVFHACTVYETNMLRRDMSLLVFPAHLPAQDVHFPTRDSFLCSNSNKMLFISVSTSAAIETRT